MGSLLSGKNAKCIVSELDQLALGGEANFCAHIKSSIPRPETGGAVLALVWVQLLATVTVNMGISRVGTGSATIVIQGIGSIVLLLALRIAGGGLLGHVRLRVSG